MCSLRTWILLWKKTLLFFLHVQLYQFYSQKRFQTIAEHFVQLASASDQFCLSHSSPYNCLSPIITCPPILSLCSHSQHTPIVISLCFCLSFIHSAYFFRLYLSFRVEHLLSSVSVCVCQRGRARERERR